MKVSSVCTNVLVGAFCFGRNLVCADLTGMIIAAGPNEIQRIVHPSGKMLVGTVVVERLEPPHWMSHRYNEVGIGPITRVVPQSPIRLGVLGTFQSHLDPSLAIFCNTINAVIHLDQSCGVIESESAKLVVVEIEFVTSFEISHHIRRAALIDIRKVGGLKEVRM